MEAVGEEQHNVALVRRFVDEIWNGGALAAADVLVAPSYINHNGLIPDLVHGPEAIKLSVALYRVAFPDFQITIDVLSADGETVMLRWTARPHMCLDPAGQLPPDAATSVSGMMSVRVVGSQIVESWIDWDQRAVLAQLGCRERAEKGRPAWLLSRRRRRLR